MTVERSYSPDELRDLIRGKTRASLYDYAWDVLGYKAMHEPLHRDIVCEWLTTWKPGKDIKVLLLPREHLKSTIASISLPLWVWSLEAGSKDFPCGPETRFMLAHGKRDMACDYLREQKHHFIRNERLRWLYPEICYDKPDKQSDLWQQDAFNVRREDASKVPSIKATGTNATVVGFHFNWAIYDDLVFKENVGTPELRAKTLQYFQQCQSLMMRGGKQLVIGTRWHWDDLYGTLLDPEGQYADIVDPLVLQSGYFVDEPIFPVSPIVEKCGFDMDRLEFRRKAMGDYEFFCNPAEAPILMADFTEKPISEIKEGDEIVGYRFKEETGHRVSIAKATVKKVMKRRAKCVSIQTSDCDVIRCTPEHRWYTGRHEEGRNVYAPAHVGSKLCRVYERDLLADRDPFELGYLIGMLDGEGSLKHVLPTIAQNEKANPVVSRSIESNLDALDLEWSNSFVESSQCNMYILNGKRNLKIGLIQAGGDRFGKACQVVENIWNKPKTLAHEWVKVESIEEDGEEDVYALETTTGNYVVWGYASKNCQYENTPKRDGSKSFLDEHFRRFRLDYDGNVPGDRKVNFVLSVDPNRSTNVGNDPCAMTVAGVDQNGEVWGVDGYRGHPTRAQMIDIMFDLALRWNVSAVILETTAGQEYLVQDFEAEMIARSRRFHLIQAKRGPTSRKEDRIMAVQAPAERGHIHLLFGEHFDLMIQEFVNFGVAKHDDLADTLADIVIHGRELKPVVQTVKRKEPPKSPFLLKTLMDGNLRSADKRVVRRVP